MIELWDKVCDMASEDASDAKSVSSISLIACVWIAIWSWSRFENVSI